MCAATRLRYFRGRRNPLGARGFEVGQSVEHRRVLIEVCSQPPAGVVIAERIEADMAIAAQVLAITSRVSAR